MTGFVSSRATPQDGSAILGRNLRASSRQQTLATSEFTQRSGQLKQNDQDNTKSPLPRVQILVSTYSLMTRSVLKASLHPGSILSTDAVDIAFSMVTCSGSKCVEDHFILASALLDKGLKREANEIILLTVNLLSSWWLARLSLANGRYPFSRPTVEILPLATESVEDLK